MGLVSNKRLIAVLRGGFGNGRVKSMAAGQEILDVLRQNGQISLLDVAVIDNNQWLVHGKVVSPGLVLSQVDGVISTIRGVYGEDGKLARDLEKFKIPLFGSSPFATSVSNNKKLSKDSLKKVGIKGAFDFRVTSDSSNDIPRLTHVAENVINSAKYIIKPTYGNSGSAIRTANSTVELARVLNNMVPDYEDVLVESFIDGKVVTCGVMSDFRHQALYTTPAVELVKINQDIFDPHHGEKVCPARLSRTEKEEIANLSKLAHVNLGLKHHSRSDFIVKDNGEVVYLETNSMPSYAADSPMREGLTVVGVGLDEISSHMIKAILLS